MIYRTLNLIFIRTNLYHVIFQWFRGIYWEASILFLERLKQELMLFSNNASRSINFTEFYVFMVLLMALLCIYV